MQVSYCNYSDLLAAIFDRDREQQRKHLGLPSQHRTCLNCDTPLRGWRKAHQKFCNPQCRSEFHTVTLSCPECGKLFKKYQSQVIWKLTHFQSANNKTQLNFYCSQKCLGKMAARNYGFIAHPENADWRRKKWNLPLDNRIFKSRIKELW